MQAGQRVAPRDDRNGACGGCRDDAPCDHCGAERNSPSYRKAQWAQLVANSRRGASEFWRTSLLAEVYSGRGSDGEAGTSIDDDDPIAMSIQRRSQLVSALASDLGSVFPSIWWEPPNYPIPLTKDHPYTPTNPNARCCPKRLRYPKGPVSIVPNTERVQSPDGAELYTLQVLFKWVAEFKPASEEADCDCLCCYFRQVIIVNEFSYYGGPPLTVDEPNGAPHGGGSRSGAMQEDNCEFWVKTEGGYESVVLPPGQIPRHADGTPLAPSEYIGPICYGNHGNPAAPPGKRGGVEPYECVYGDDDTPYQRVPTTASSFGWTWLSEALILDRCKLDIVRRRGYMAFRLSGSIQADGPHFDGGAPKMIESTDWHAEDSEDGR